MRGVWLRLLRSSALMLVALGIACAAPPLTEATRRGDLALVRTLLAAGERPNASGHSTSPLHEAAQRGYVEITEQLLESGAEIEARDGSRRTPLMEAVRREHRDVAALLIARGAKLDARESGEKTALHIAVANRDPAMTRFLLVSGASSNVRDTQLETPLYLAVRARQSELVLILLSHQGNPNLPDRNGRTPLLQATQDRQVELVRILIAAGAEVNRRDHNSESPLSRAVNDRHRELVSMLLGAGADSNDVDQNGNPVLVRAVEQSDEEVVHLLLDADANPDARDRGGRRAIHIARANQDTRTAELLLSHDADPETWANEIAEELGDPLAYAAKNGYLALARAYIENSAVLAANETKSAEEQAREVPSPGVLPDSVGPEPRSAASKHDGLSAPFYSRQVAVVIGIDEYLEWPPLEGAEEDARRVAHTLRERGFDEVIELYGRQATRTRMMTILGGVLARETDAQSLAFIYFAGHGQTETLPSGEKRGYILPVDSHPDYVFATGIATGTLRELSNRLPAKQVYYAMDSCYSGLGFTRGVAVLDRESPDYIEKLASQRAVQMITAGSENEQVVERGGRGLFTTYFLRALSGEADFDGDGWVTANEIGTWVKPQVSAASGNRQTPQFGSLLGAGEVVFRAR